MVSRWITLFAALLHVAPLMAQTPHKTHVIAITLARFMTGDNSAWRQPGFDDHDWKKIQTGNVWQQQGYPDYHGYAWYRIHVVIPSSLKQQAVWKDSLRIFLAHVNDVDETWLNGTLIGHTGAFPDEPGGYISKWPAERSYQLSINDTAIHWNKENIIAVRVYDGGGTGGIFMGTPYIRMLEKMDGVQVDVPSAEMIYQASGNATVPVIIQNRFNTTITTRLTCKVWDASLNKYLLQIKRSLVLKPFDTFRLPLQLPNKEGIELLYTLQEQSSLATISRRVVVPYLLTPAESDSPHINGANIVGARAGTPFLFRIPVSGRRPITFSVANLPPGLILDPEKGIISGQLVANGDYPVTLTAMNALGKTEKLLTIRIGDAFGLTPAMGWNSWNCWGLSVSDEKVRSSAQALIDKGLINHGWNYINIDDGWEAAQRNTDGTLSANNKFPDMRGLGDWIHSQGLKLGIYSSPGDKTCGGYLGSYHYEDKDAATYASWGVDYLKYDWCSYSDVVKYDDTVTEHYIHPYRLMQEQLQKQPRDIYYSLCQYGMKNVEQWGAALHAQSWRTTEDIEDTWESMKHIGFSQAPLYKYAGPGHWNDPDMLIVGMVGWGENLHPTRLTPYEQYSHITLWSLLSAPLLIGCDISKMDAFTLNLLTNDAVIAIDQDALGKQAQQVVKDAWHQVWVKELAIGSKAIGIFNMSDSFRKISVSWSALGLKQTQRVTDVWRQKTEGVIKNSYIVLIPPHGSKLLEVRN